MHFGQPAEIFGVDGVIVLVVVVLVLFGSTQIPKLARSLGSAQKEFKKGLDEGAREDAQVVHAPVMVAGPPPQPVQPVQVQQPIQPVQVQQPIQPVQVQQPIQPVQVEQPSGDGSSAI